jgi:hypothetical protein
MSEAVPNPPAAVFQAGNITAILWENLVRWEDRMTVRYSVRFRKTFRDRQTGLIRNTDCFFVDDLPAVILVAQKCYRSCVARRKRSSRGTADRQAPGERGGIAKGSSRKLGLGPATTGPWDGPPWPEVPS